MLQPQPPPPPQQRRWQRQRRQWQRRWVPDCLLRTRELLLQSAASLHSCVLRGGLTAAPYGGARASASAWLRGVFCCSSASGASASSSPAPAGVVRAWRTEAQLAAWQARRSQAARRAVALHWGGTLLLPLLCGLDPRFRDAAGGVVDYLAVSMLAAMALFAIVSFSDPGFLPLPALAPPEERGRALPPRIPLLQQAPPPPVTGAGELGALIPETEAGVAAVAGMVEQEEEEEEEEEEGSCSGGWSSSSSSLVDDDDEDETAEEEEKDETAAADAEVRRLTSPSRAHNGGHRMRAFAIVDPLGIADDEQAALCVPGVRAWLRQRHCAVCGLDRLPIRTKHCNACGRCVARLDHHGPLHPLLGHNCVGAGNHVAFVLFLLAQCAHLTLLLALLLAVQLPAFFSTYITLDHPTAAGTHAQGLLPALLRGLTTTTGGGFHPLAHLLLLALPEALLHWPLQSLLVGFLATLWVTTHAALLRQLKVVLTNRLTAEARARPGECPYLLSSSSTNPRNAKPNPFDRGCALNTLSFLSLFYSFHRERRRRKRQREGQLRAATQAAAAVETAAAAARSEEVGLLPVVVISRCPSAASSSDGGSSSGDDGDRVPLLGGGHYHYHYSHKGAPMAAAGGLHSLSSTPSTLSTAAASPTASLGGSSVVTAASMRPGGGGGGGGAFFGFFRRKLHAGPTAAATPSFSLFRAWRTGGATGSAAQAATAAAKPHKIV